MYYNNFVYYYYLNLDWRLESYCLWDIYCCYNFYCNFFIVFYLSLEFIIVYYDYD